MKTADICKEYRESKNKKQQYMFFYLLDHKDEFKEEDQQDGSSEPITEKIGG